ncbi:MAG: hypothetical protein Q4G58_17950 [bacterium]|nr:hypothetical protein [bacterium]
MDAKDLERLKQIVDEKKKGSFFHGEKKIGVGKVQQRHKNIKADFERTKKISQ